MAAFLMALSICSSHGSLRGQTVPNCTAAQNQQVAYYFNPALLQLNLILSTPPPENSLAAQRDLAAVHATEQSRTKQEIAKAQADDKEQDLFIFSNVIGPGFTATRLPLTAAFSTHIHSDEGVASDPLKTTVGRPRPYQLDKTLHPVCKVTTIPNSFPSGHSLGGYLFALTLIQILPEKKEQIMQRADEYAYSRIVCGVHYPTDLQASRELAFAIFGNMLANPRFQKDLATARDEIRTKLGPSAASSQSNMPSLSR